MHFPTFQCSQRLSFDDSVQAINNRHEIKNQITIIGNLILDEMNSRIIR